MIGWFRIFWILIGLEMDQASLEQNWGTFGDEVYNTDPEGAPSIGEGIKWSEWLGMRFSLK